MSEYDPITGPMADALDLVRDLSRHSVCRCVGGTGYRCKRCRARAVLASLDTNSLTQEEWYAAVRGALSLVLSVAVGRHYAMQDERLRFLRDDVISRVDEHVRLAVDELSARARHVRGQLHGRSFNPGGGNDGRG